jgi:2-dehydropantoate 2-reductase
LVSARSARSSARSSGSPAPTSPSSGASAGAPKRKSAGSRPEKIVFAIEAIALAPCDVVLCAVKSAQTKQTGAEIAKVVRDATLVISLQNGLHNADALREVLPKAKVLGGIVGFNVVVLDDGTMRRATTGPLAIEASDDSRLAELANELRKAGFEVELPTAFRAVQWSKLVMNLNNALSALSGAPTRDLLFEPGYRRIVRALLVESLAIMKAGGIETARLGPLPVRAFPFMLSLPTPLLKLAARAQLKVDPEARSSMWRDLDLRRSTEVDELNGEIVRLATKLGRRAPINERLVALVHEAEAAAKGSPNLSASDLSRALEIHA